MALEKRYDPATRAWYVVDAYPDGDGGTEYIGTAAPTEAPARGSHAEFIAYLHSPFVEIEGMRAHQNKSRLSL